MTNKVEYSVDNPCFEAAFAHASVNWFINKQKASIDRSRRRIMNKSMEVSQAVPVCECGLCVDCMDAAEYARLMDEARAEAEANGDICNVCNAIGVLTQGACYDCCRLCTECTTEPRHPNSMLCDKCLANTIKPGYSVPRGRDVYPRWPANWGSNATVGNITHIELHTMRQGKHAHLKRTCAANCDYCYKEAEKYLAENVIECPACSEAGGADMPVYHLPPVCASDAQVNNIVNTLRNHPPKEKNNG